MGLPGTDRDIRQQSFTFEWLKLLVPNFPPQNAYYYSSEQTPHLFCEEFRIHNYPPRSGLRTNEGDPVRLQGHREA